MSEFDGTHPDPHSEPTSDPHGHPGEPAHPFEAEHDFAQHEVELTSEDWSAHLDEPAPGGDEPPAGHETPPHDAEPAGYEEPVAGAWSPGDAVHAEPVVGNVFDVHHEPSLTGSMPSTHDVDDAIGTDHATSWSAAGLNPTHVETDPANATLLANLEPQAGTSLPVPLPEWGAHAAELWTAVTGEPAPNGVPHDATQTIALLHELSNQPCDPLDADVVQQMLNALES